MEYTEQSLSSSGIGLTLVTGGAGFIGSHVVDRLITNDIEVKVVDNLSAGSISNLSACKDNEKFQFINKDLNDSESLKETLKDVAIETTGGVDNGRGWMGDIKKMHLEISRLKELAWSPKLSSVEATKLASQELLKDSLVEIIGS